jgi:hypothetical protein
MNRWISSAVLRLVAALAPVSVSAALIDVSDVVVKTVAVYTTQGRPARSAEDIKSAPAGGLTRAEVLVLADGIPFPNVPTSQTTAFASSVAFVNGIFGAA